MKRQAAEGGGQYIHMWMQHIHLYMHLYVYMCACNNVGKIAPNRCGCKGQKRCAAIVASAAGDCDQIDRSDILVAST